MTHWGDRITEVRAASGLGRVDFGLRIGEPHHVVQSWECDGCEPLIHTALQTSTRLGLRVDDLTGPHKTPWGGDFMESPMLMRDATRWRENMTTLARVAGSQAQLARDLRMSQATVHSWIRRGGVPVLRSAAEVREMTGIFVHTLLSEVIDDQRDSHAVTRAIAHARRVKRRTHERQRSPTPVAR